VVPSAAGKRVARSAEDGALSPVPQRRRAGGPADFEYPWERRGSEDVEAHAWIALMAQVEGLGLGTFEECASAGAALRRAAEVVERGTWSTPSHTELDYVGGSDVG
jgi:hypothetical protein